MPYTYDILISDKTTSGSIQNFVNRSDIPSDLILTEAQAFIYERLRVREMMVLEDITITNGSFQTAVPSGFLDPVRLTPYGWGGGLPYQSEDKFLLQRNDDGTKVQDSMPSAFTVIGTNIVLDIQLNADLGAELISYQTPAALAANNTTNFLTTRYPTILRHSLMSFAYEHMKDAERSLAVRQMVEAEIVAAGATNELYRRGQY